MTTSRWLLIIKHCIYSLHERLLLSEERSIPQVWDYIFVCHIKSSCFFFLILIIESSKSSIQPDVGCPDDKQQQQQQQPSQGPQCGSSASLQKGLS